MKCVCERMHTRPTNELWNSRQQNIKFKVFRHFCDFWLHYHAQKSLKGIKRTTNSALEFCLSILLPKSFTEF